MTRSKGRARYIYERAVITALVFLVSGVIILALMPQRHNIAPDPAQPYTDAEAAERIATHLGVVAGGRLLDLVTAINGGVTVYYRSTAQAVTDLEAEWLDLFNGVASAMLRERYPLTTVTLVDNRSGLRVQTQAADLYAYRDQTLTRSGFIDQLDFAE